MAHDWYGILTHGVRPDPSAEGAQYRSLNASNGQFALFPTVEAPSDDQSGGLTDVGTSIRL